MITLISRGPRARECRKVPAGASPGAEPAKLFRIGRPEYECSSDGLISPESPSHRVNGTAIVC
jgi:hypothetical protein